MKRKIYIAAKMRGLPYYNFPAFDKARDRLAGLGLTPLSPADMDRAAGFDPYTMFDEHLVALAADGGPSCWDTTPPSFDLAAAIARDNAAIDDPETVAVYVIHEGISESAGGMAEIERAMKAGKVILFDTMTDAEILRALGPGDRKADFVDPAVVAEAVAQTLKDDPYARIFSLGRDTPPVTPLGQSAKTASGLATGARYSERGGVLDEAKSLICGDRNSQYGPPSQDFERTAGMMNALFGHMLQEGKAFKSRDVAWIMMMVKASRSQHAPKRDNYVDAAGYAACGWECETETQKKGNKENA